MRLPRTFIIAALIALTALVTVGFGTPLGFSGLRKDAAAPQDVVLTAVTGDVTPLSHGVLAPLGPLGCPAGTTMNSARSCNDPKVQCANGATTVLGLTCPPAPAPAPPPPEPAVADQLQAAP
jgi:hypothetical protein